MSLLPMYKICPKCKRKYSWNPDVGKIHCPHCGVIGVSCPLEKAEKKSGRSRKMP